MHYERNYGTKGSKVQSASTTGSARRALFSCGSKVEGAKTDAVKIVEASSGDLVAATTQLVMPNTSQGSGDTVDGTESNAAPGDASAEKLAAALKTVADLQAC